MADLILDNTYLILLLPLWIFLIIMCGRFFAVYVNKHIIHILTLLSSFLGILLCSISLSRVDTTIEQTIPFIKINDFILYFGIHIDKLSLIIALTLFLVSFCIQLFSISYMKNEPKTYRFYALLNLFNFAMAGLLFSPNLFQFYAFWELVGVISYALIGLEYKKSSKSIASKRVFLINRIGDTALLGGILAVSYLMYNYGGNLSFTTLSFVDLNAISTLLCAYTSTPQFILICVLFIIGSAVKSAQFPAHIWLQDAMEAKLPVSALLHSATMVIAGVFLIEKLLPIFLLNSTTLVIIGTIGAFTALICSILASIETQPKKVLAYSTSANIGLMFLALSFLNIKAAIIFLVAHAFIKSMLFLTLPKENEDLTYINFITFLLGALSLAGLMFSGLIGKELIFASIKNNIPVSIIYVFVAFMTAFYILRLPLVMIQNRNLKNGINIIEFIPSATLFFLNIGFYFFLKNKVQYQVAEPFWIALTAWVVVYILYTNNLLTKFSNTTKFIPNFCYNIVPAMYSKFADTMNFIELKMFSNYQPIIFCAKLKIKIAGWIETNIMNKSVSLISNSAKKFSEWDMKLQSGNIQTYNAYAFILVTIVISFVIIAYTFMLSQLS